MNESNHEVSKETQQALLHPLIYNPKATSFKLSYWAVTSIFLNNMLILLVSVISNLNIVYYLSIMSQAFSILTSPFHPQSSP